jgi:hypothetical protein
VTVVHSIQALFVGGIGPASGILFSLETQILVRANKSIAVMPAGQYYELPRTSRLFTNSLHKRYSKWGYSIIMPKPAVHADKLWAPGAVGKTEKGRKNSLVVSDSGQKVELSPTLPISVRQALIAPSPAVKVAEPTLFASAARCT